MASQTYGSAPQRIGTVKGKANEKQDKVKKAGEPKQAKKAKTLVRPGGIVSGQMENKRYPGVSNENTEAAQSAPKPYSRIR